MKYSEKYPDAWDTGREWKDSGVLYDDSVAPCRMCGESTHFIDYCTESRVCSEECCLKQFD